MFFYLFYSVDTFLWICIRESTFTSHPCTSIHVYIRSISTNNLHIHTNNDVRWNRAQLTLPCEMPPRRPDQGPYSSGAGGGGIGGGLSLDSHENSCNTSSPPHLHLSTDLLNLSLLCCNLFWEKKPTVIR